MFDQGEGKPATIASLDARLGVDFFAKASTNVVESGVSTLTNYQLAARGETPISLRGGPRQ
jgi:hypothetical protein